MTCVDLAVEPVSAIERVRALNPKVRLCCYGLYAALNESCLRGLGVEWGRSPTCPIVSQEKQKFLAPDRSDLPPLERYAHLHLNGARQRVGYTEASRGCKHLCRHCPVVPVYNGRFRIVQAEVVLEDIRRQVAAGARHITFGDPDFLNGPGHALRLVEALHTEFPWLTYDVTIKIEGPRKHRALLPRFQSTGCLLVTSAVESLEDQVLAKLDKGHTREDFIAVVEDCRAAGLALAPAFVPFTPWTTRAGYRDLLRRLVELDLVESVSPVQLALRLLIPAGSHLLGLPDIRELLGRFDEAALAYPWKHPDPSLDELSAKQLHLVWAEQSQATPRTRIFSRIWELAYGQPLRRCERIGRTPRKAGNTACPTLQPNHLAVGGAGGFACQPIHSHLLRENFDLRRRATIPYLDEPWYC